jgi:hypothetical protein
MSLPRRRMTWARVIAASACLTALAVYSVFSPPASRADIEPLCDVGCCQCSYGTGTYTEGACHHGSSCTCEHYQDGSCRCTWVCCCQ